VEPEDESAVEETVVEEIVVEDALFDGPAAVVDPTDDTVEEVAAEPAEEASPDQPTLAESLTILAGESVHAFRARMVEAYEQFGSDPAQAVAQAELVVADAVAALHRALLEGAVSLAGWRRRSEDELADVMRTFREYLDRMLAI
jgi:hypothetical protein